MTPINSSPKKAGAAAIVPWIVGILILIGLFAFPHEVRTLDASASGSSSDAQVAIVATVPSSLSSRTVARLAALPRTRIEEHHSIDTVTAGSTTTVIAQGASLIKAVRGTVVTVTGWAADQKARAASSAVVAIVDGHLFGAKVGVIRDDVAVALASPAYAPSGFRLDIETAQLPLGRSVATFYGVDARGKESYDLHRSLTLDLTSS